MSRLAGFIGPSDTAPSVVVNASQTVNWIPAKIDSGTGAAPYVFDPAPGFAAGMLSDTGPGWRASYELNDLAYCVIGGSLVQVFVSPPAESVLATIGGSTPHASITANGEAGHQVMAANGEGDLYWYDTISHTNGLITTVEGHIVAFMNSYFIALNTDTSEIYVSAPFDGTAWDAGDAAQRSDFPDNWLAMIVRLPDLLLFGTESVSVYYNDPASDFPFVPNPSIAITRGIRAPASLALLQGNPIWLADDLTVRYMRGYNPERVSTHAIEYAIAQYPNPEDADAFTYNEQGHSFYVLNFPSIFEVFAGASWCYDVTSGLWHQRGPYNSMTDAFEVLPINYAMQVGGVQIAGSRTTLSWYFMSQAYAHDIDPATGGIGDGLTRRRRAPNLVNELTRVIYDAFTLFMEVGAYSVNPDMTLKWSSDGGQTFNAGTTISAGASLDYTKRVIWRQLGQGRNRVFQVQSSAIAPLRLVDAYLQARPGIS